MSQFSSVRGVVPGHLKSEVLLDTRKAVRLEGKVGNVEAVIEGDLVVAVTPLSNDTTAAIFVNDVKVFGAQPFETPAQQKAFKQLCDDVVKHVKKGTLDKIV